MLRNHELLNERQDLILRLRCASVFAFAAIAISFAAGPAFGQSLKIIPDSATPGATLMVDIVGHGVHFGPPTSASEVTDLLVMLSTGSDTVVRARGYQRFDDSTFSTYLSFYGIDYAATFDLTVQKTSVPTATYTQAAAFRISDASGTINGVSPKSPYQGQQCTLTILGTGTLFQKSMPRSEYANVTITLRHNGTVVLVTHPTNIPDPQLMEAPANFPANAPTGSYDVEVVNTGAHPYSYTGAAVLTVQSGTAPTISISPNSGSPGQGLPVTITGQGTNFQPVVNQSSGLGYIQIQLNDQGKEILRVNPSTMDQLQHLNTVFYIPSNIAPGEYTVRVYKLYPPDYDFETPFFIGNPSTLSIAQTSAKTGDTIAISVLAQGAHFIAQNGSQTLYSDSATLLYESYAFDAAQVSVPTDTTLSATFIIPDTADFGSYQLEIPEAGTGKKIYSPQGLVTISNGGAIVSVLPDSTIRHVTDTLTISGLHVKFEGNVQSVYLLQHAGSARLDGVPLTYSPSFTARFVVPATATPGLYDLWVSTRNPAISLMLDSAFTVSTLLGVPESPTSALIEGTAIAKPNPASGIVKIAFDMSSSARVEVRIQDNLGREVLHPFNDKLEKGAHEVQFDLSQLPNGVYFYLLIESNVRRTGKFVLNR